MSTEFKPYFRVGENPDSDIARVYQEERRVDDLCLRIVKAQHYARQRIEKDKWEYNRHSGAEKEATINSFNLADDGYNFIIWISPEDGDIYDEGRLNVMLPVSVNGEIELQPWGIPLLINRKESRQLADRLLKSGGVSMDPVTNEESVRRQPIGFKLEENEKWLDRCRKLLPEWNEEWDFIEQGGVEKQMEVIMEMVVRAKKIAGGNNYLFEKTMAVMGYRLNIAGGHGGSWLGRGMGTSGIWQYKINRMDGVIQTEVIKVGGKYICPICGMEVGEGETICVGCGMKLKAKIHN